jgi:hypothetical protein
MSPRLDSRWGGSPLGDAGIAPAESAGHILAHRRLVKGQNRRSRASPSFESGRLDHRELTPVSHSAADAFHAMLAASLRDLLNRGKSTQPAAHSFYRRHDNSRDLRGRRANSTFARSVRCAKAIDAPERRRSCRAGRPLQHRPGCSGLGREPGFGSRALGFHSSRQRPTGKDSNPAQLSSVVKTFRSSH